MGESLPVSISVAEARQIDRDAVEHLGIPSIVLMENAAKAAASVAATMGEQWVVYCGPGNNGGDGLAMARHLGRLARVFLMSEPDPQRYPDAALQLQILRRAGHPVAVGDMPPDGLATDVIIDAMFGTGLSRPLVGKAAAWIAQFNQSPGRKLCIDIPSGLDGDTGAELGVACCADTTVTFVAPKHGLLKAPGHVGALVVAGIGLPEKF